MNKTKPKEEKKPPGFPARTREESIRIFHSNYDRGSKKECWNYNRHAARHNNDYGQFFIDGKQTLAHRLALELHLKRKIKPGMKALHKCDNPRCVNPYHLWEGTQPENITDMIKKGRARYTGNGGRPGESSARALLTDEAVLWMRNLFARKKITCKKIVRLLRKKYGIEVAKNTVWGVLTGVSWKNVGGPIVPTTGAGFKVTPDLVEWILKKHEKGIYSATDLVELLEKTHGVRVHFNTIRRVISERVARVPKRRKVFASKITPEIVK